MGNSVQNLLSYLLDQVEGSKSVLKYDAEDKHVILQSGIVVSKSVKEAAIEAKQLTDEEIDQIGLVFNEKLFKILRS